MTAVLAGTAYLVNLAARRAERIHPPEGKFIVVDGVRLHYLERGQGTPVIFLHGNGAVAQDFAISGVLDATAQRYHAIAFDRPGFGYSERPEGRLWTPQAQARLIGKALDTLGIQHAIIVGHSWGTLVALALAMQRPETIRSLVLVSGYYFPTLRWDVLALSTLALPIIGPVLRHTLLPIATGLLMNQILERLFAPEPVSQKFRSGFPFGLLLRPSQLAAVSAETALMIPSAAALSLLYRRLETPTVIVTGSGDRLFGTMQSIRLHDTLPDAELRSMTRAGHMAHHAAPDQIVAAIDHAATMGALPPENRVIHMPDRESPHVL